MNQKRLIQFGVTALVVIGFGAIALAGMSTSSSDDSSNAGTQRQSMNESDHRTPKASTPENEAVKSDQITYKDFEVVQKKITVKKGTTVTWTNDDSAKHDVTPETETDDFKTSELFGKGETYSVTFNTVGTFAYYCSPHPYMKGVVEVTE